MGEMAKINLRIHTSLQDNPEARQTRSTGRLRLEEIKDHKDLNSDLHLKTVLAKEAAAMRLALNMEHQVRVIDQALHGSRLVNRLSVVVAVEVSHSHRTAPLMETRVSIVLRLEGEMEALDQVLEDKVNVLKALMVPHLLVVSKHQAAASAGDSIPKCPTRHI